MSCALTNDALSDLFFFLKNIGTYNMSSIQITSLKKIGPHLGPPKWAKSWPDLPSLVIPSLFLFFFFVFLSKFGFFFLKSHASFFFTYVFLNDGCFFKYFVCI